MDDILAITLRVAAVCERLGIPYLVGGSLASSLHGIPRATEDVDMVLAIGQRDVPGFANALRHDFYLDEDAIREAIARSSSFNLVHLASFLKVDVFVAKDDEPSRLQMARGIRYHLGEEPPRSLLVAAAEDVIAQKLYWYSLGSRVSERQWNDAIGVLKVSSSRLDLRYLVRVATMLGVESLVRQACDEVGLALP